MEISIQDCSLLFGGSREATALLRNGEVLYQNDAVTSLLGELPLSMVLSALPKDIRGDFALSEKLYGHALELTGQRIGEFTLLRLRSIGEETLIHPALIAELRDLLFSQQLTVQRLLDSLSEQESDLYGSSVRRSYFGLLNFTRRLGDASQLSAGGLVVSPELLDLSQLYRDAIFALKLVLPKKYPSPTLIADEGCYMNADATRMEELLFYLLHNALCHCSGEDSIRVRLRREKDTVRLSVEDNGSGMDSNTVSRLFDPFASPLLNGRLSLGLTLAKGIAHAHGGSLLIQSRIEEGTKVLVSLPAVNDPDLPVSECVPPEGIGIIQRIMVNLLDLGAYREMFDD